VTELRCGFEYTARWPQIVEDLLSGDPARIAAATQTLDDRDRELELWSGTICECCHEDTVATFTLDVVDESNASGFVDIDVDISAGSHTVSVDYNDVTDPSHTFFGSWANDPLGTATPFANSAGGVGPHTAASTDVWPGGTMTIRVSATAETAAFNDVISYVMTVT
jgi:hypothetical protein